MYTAGPAADMKQDFPLKFPPSVLFDVTGSLIEPPALSTVGFPILLAQSKHLYGLPLGRQGFFQGYCEGKLTVTKLGMVITAWV